MQKSCQIKTSIQCGTSSTGTWQYLTSSPDASLSAEPVLIPATVAGGVVKKWRGKYNALLNCDGVEQSYASGVDASGLKIMTTNGMTCVDGWAYLVETEEHEEALRLYETENYEIVRCTISMEDRSDVVKGLTFKFVGPSEDLV